MDASLSRVIALEVGPLAFFSTADNGSILYRRPTKNLSQLTWVDRSGRVLSTLGDPGSIANFRISPGLAAVSHVYEHLAYHAGQIIYLTKSKRGKDLRFTRLPPLKRTRKRTSARP